MISSNNTWLALMQLSINFFVYVFFVLYLFRGKTRRSMCFNILSIGGYIVASIIFILLFQLEDAPFAQYRYYTLVLWLAVTVGMCVLLLHSSVLQFFFMILVILNLQSNIMIIADLLFEHGVLDTLVRHNEMRRFLLANLVLLLFLPFMKYLFLDLFKKVISMNINRGYWKYLFTVPVSIYLYSIFTYRHKIPMSIKHIGAALGMVIFLNVFTCLSYVAILQLLLKTQESFIAMKETDVLERQLQAQKEQYSEMTKNIEQTERLRHDVRHHFITLQGYLNTEDYDGAMKYLTHCIGKELPKEKAPVCRNHSVDMILRHYIGVAEERGIRVKTRIDMPEELSLPVTELCAIYGNLVENALEACDNQTEGEKFIIIRTKLANQRMLMVVVANSYNGVTEQSGKDFLSTKHEGLGIGTNSVRHIAEKNGGTCKFTYTSQMFTASVLLVI